MTQPAAERGRRVEPMDGGERAGGGMSTRYDRCRAGPRSAMADIDRGLPPLVGERPRILILGSMPGRASLRAGAYYAHPRNAFWSIAEALFGVDARQPYAQRCAALTRAGVALWDVIGSCRRPGSLDARIDPRSIRINPVDELIRAQPGIELIGFNGSLAGRLFRRHLQARMPEPGPRLCALPSSSPAHAALRPAEKIAAWRALLAAADERSPRRA